MEARTQMHYARRARSGTAPHLQLRGGNQPRHLLRRARRWHTGKRQPDAICLLPQARFRAVKSPGTARARSLIPESGIAQQHLTTFEIDGKQYDVAIRGEYDGIEHVARLYFAEVGGSIAGIPDRGVFSGATLGEAIERAQRLTHEDLTRRLKRAQAAKRRFFQLRHAVDEMLENVKYMNQVATSVRAGIIDLEGGDRELDLIEEKLIATVRRLRRIAGVEG